VGEKLLSGGIYPGDVGRGRYRHGGMIARS